MVATQNPVELPECNGWKNYATWNAWGWITNDSVSYNQMVELALSGADVWDVRAFVKRYVLDSPKSAGCWRDIQDWSRQYGKSLLWGLEQIDYHRIWEHMRDLREENEAYKNLA